MLLGTTLKYNFSQKVESKLRCVGKTGKAGALCHCGLDANQHNPMEGNVAMTELHVPSAFDLAIPLLGIHPEAMPPTIRKYASVGIFTAALSVTVKYQKPLIEETG